MEKVNQNVYIGQLISDNHEEIKETYMAYILRTDGQNIVAQDVFEYIHTQPGINNNPHLEEKCYLVDAEATEYEYNNCLPYSANININKEYSIKPMMKLASANEKTEEEIVELIVMTALPMVEQFGLLHGYTYKKIKNIKNI